MRIGALQGDIENGQYRVMPDQVAEKIMQYLFSSRLNNNVKAFMLTSSRSILRDILF
jgi:hypothetical protein